MTTSRKYKSSLQRSSSSRILKPAGSKKVATQEVVVPVAASEVVVETSEDVAAVKPVGILLIATLTSVHSAKEAM